MAQPSKQRTARKKATTAARSPAREANFAAPVVLFLRDEVGNRCSLCERPTSGPSRHANKKTIVGVAAHITAASKGGPRYDASLTRQQRSSAPNGIWCCCDCGKIIDDDVATFTVARLQEIKADAIARAHRDITTGIVQSSAKSKPGPGLSLEALRDGWLAELDRMRAFTIEAAQHEGRARDSNHWETPFWNTRRSELRRHFARCDWWTSTSTLYKGWRDARRGFPTFHRWLRPTLTSRLNLVGAFHRLEDTRARIDRLKTDITADAEISSLTAQDRQDAIRICVAGAKSASGTYRGFAVSMGLKPDSPACRLALAAWKASAQAQPREQDAAAADLLRSGWTPKK